MNGEKVKLYNYPDYSSLSPQGSSKFLEEATSFLTGEWKDQSILTPSIIPKTQNLAERDLLCNRKHSDTTGPYQLMYYQRAVTALINPNTRCRRILVCSSMGTGKTIMVGEIIASFANISLYPGYTSDVSVSDFKKEHAYPLRQQDIVPTLEHHPCVPSRILFCTISRKIESQMYRDFTFCRSLYHPFFKKLWDKYGHIKDREVLGETIVGALDIKVEFLPMVKVGNLVRNNNLDIFKGALVILDEVHSCFTPEDVTTKTWWKALPHVLDLTSKVNLYGLVGLTGTPIINSYTNVIDLHRLMVSGDQYLQAKDIMKSSQFKAKYVVQKPIDIDKKRMHLSIEQFMKSCDWTSDAYSDYHKANYFRVEAKHVLKSMYDSMQQYVFVYDASQDKIRMAPKKTEVDTNRERFKPNPHSPSSELMQWTVKSLYRKEGQQYYDKHKNMDTIPIKLVRSRLYQSMLVIPLHPVSVSKYLNITFPLKILKNKGDFMSTLRKESPVFYKLVQRLTGRRGKSLIYAVVPSKYGAEVFGELMRRYVLANPKDNVILPVPEDQMTNINGYINDHILFDKDEYFVNNAAKQNHKRNVQVFEDSKERGLQSPIYFFYSKLSTGFSVNGGVQELHILTPSSEQVEGRGHRLLAHCGAEWRYDVYKYVNAGLYPKLTTCDMIHEVLTDKSNVKRIISYFEQLLSSSSLCCGPLAKLFGLPPTRCSSFPDAPKELFL